MHGIYRLIACLMVVGPSTGAMSCGRDCPPVAGVPANVVRQGTAEVLRRAGRPVSCELVQYDVRRARANGTWQLWSVSYAPPETDHMIIRTTILQSGARAYQLGDPSDWWEIILARLPLDSIGAIHACEDVMESTGPGAFGEARPSVYDDGVRFGPDSVFAMVYDSSQTALTGPVARRAGPAWQVEAWVLEANRAALYSCSLSAETGATISLLAVRLGLGYPVGP